MEKMVLMVGDRSVELDRQWAVEIAKANANVDVDFAEMPDAAIAYFLGYGVKQSLNDAAASAKAGDTDGVMGLVNKRLDNLRNGTIRAVGGRIGDSVRARAVAIAMKHAPKGDPKAKRAWAIAAVDRNPAFMHLAERQIDDEKALNVEFAPAS